MATYRSNCFKQISGLLADEYPNGPTSDLPFDPFILPFRPMPHSTGKTQIFFSALIRKFSSRRSGKPRNISARLPACAMLASSASCGF
jgi:hypothetical protein